MMLLQILEWAIGGDAELAAMMGLRSDNPFYFLDQETTGDADGRCMKDVERQASAANA